MSKEDLMNNLSSYEEDFITWYDYIASISNNDQLSSYQIKAFINDYHNYAKIEEISSIKTTNPEDYFDTLNMLSDEISEEIKGFILT